jgi:hypothetical protein
VDDSLHMHPIRQAPVPTTADLHTQRSESPIQNYFIDVRPLPDSG